MKNTTTLLRTGVVGLAAVGVLMFIPSGADAATMVAREQLSLSPAERVMGNLYAAGGSVSVGAPVTGDLVAGGGTLAVTGAVSGDVLMGGGTVQLLGSVTGDVRAAAGQLSIAGRVGGDVVVVGGTVHLLPGAVIGGDLLAASGTVIIDGEVRGKVKTAGGMLTLNGTVGGGIDARTQERLVIGESARISGGLTYEAPSEAVIASGARIIGAVTFKQSLRFKPGDFSAGKVAGALGALVTGFGMLVALGMTALVVWRYRRQALDVVAETHSAFWPSLGRGFVYAILTPIAALLLLVSVIGTLPGMLVLMIYGALWIITKTLAGILLGSLVVKVAKRSQTLHITWASALGGTILFRLVSLIPVVGWLIAMFLVLAVFGVLAARAQKAVL